MDANINGSTSSRARVLHQQQPVDNSIPLRPRRSRVFTPAAVEVIRRLAAQGKSASAIAAAIGSTPASVRVRCCQLRISLSRRGRPRSLPRQSGDVRHRLVVYLRPDRFTALTRKAANLRKTSVELAEDLLDAIVTSDIYEAVLDDGGELGMVETR